MKLLSVNLGVSAVDVIVVKIGKCIVVPIVAFFEELGQVEIVLGEGRPLDDSLSNVQELVDVLDDLKTRLPEA